MRVSAFTDPMSAARYFSVEGNMSQFLRYRDSAQIALFRGNDIAISITKCALIVRTADKILDINLNDRKR